MDKGRKLRRYSRKDYTQLVDFPVEIVGRDGVVRRYSFEESVRLYQRRIASASMRYEDGDIVTAEVRHCRRRIGQLRESYFARYGWAALRVPGGGQLDGELAGEVAAFLRKCVGPGLGDGLDGLELSFLGEEADHRLYFVHGEGGLLDGGSAILYLYRFETGGSCPEREAFFDYLKVLQTVRKAGPGVETLVAFHHTADCGLILSRQAAAHEALSDAAPTSDDPAWDEPGEAADDPVREAMVLLRKGRAPGALALLEAAYEEQPYRRSAYMAAAVVADQLGEHARGETAALMGSRYFSGDRLLGYHLAAARLRLRDPDGAEQALEPLLGEHGEAAAVRLLQSILRLERGRLRAGARGLRDAARGAAADSDIHQAARTLRLQLLARRLLRIAGAALGLAATLAWFQGPPLAALLAVPGAGLWWGAHRLWRRQLGASLAGRGSDGLRLATPGALGDRDGAGRSQ